MPKLRPNEAGPYPGLLQVSAVGVGDRQEVSIAMRIHRTSFYSRIQCFYEIYQSRGKFCDMNRETEKNKDSSPIEEKSDFPTKGGLMGTIKVGAFSGRHEKAKSIIS